MHELLRGLGYFLDIHPDLPTGETTQPDFLAVSQSGEEVIIEAVAAVKKSEENLATSNRKQTVLDTIDKLDHLDFYVWLHEEGSPTTSPSGRKIRDKLKRWLDHLSYDAFRPLVESGQFDKLPTRTFEENGWTLEFRAFPKPKKRRGQSSDRLIHLHEGGAHWIDSRTPIRDAIRRKATKYGDVQRPYIVAVNAIGHFLDDIDISEALFGKEVLEFRVGPGLEMQHRMSRKPDGAWTSEKGERNTRISGVLIGRNVFPSSVANASVALYHSPWAQRQYSGLLSALKQYLPKAGGLEESEGIHPRVVFSLDESWLQNTE